MMMQTEKLKLGSIIFACSTLVQTYMHIYKNLMADLFSSMMYSTI
jgi:hypothetical protein